MNKPLSQQYTSWLEKPSTKSIRPRGLKRDHLVWGQLYFFWCVGLQQYLIHLVNHKGCHFFNTLIKSTMSGIRWLEQSLKTMKKNFSNLLRLRDRTTRQVLDGRNSIMLMTLGGACMKVPSIFITQLVPSLFCSLAPCSIFLFQHQCNFPIKLADCLWYNKYLLVLQLSQQC